MISQSKYFSLSLAILLILGMATFISCSKAEEPGPPDDPGNNDTVPELQFRLKDTFIYSAG